MTEITERLKTAIVDRYVIERELGQGGMATVYLAHDVKHDRKVALKVLRPELAAVIGAERFLQEIKVTANLQHSHILPLYDSGAAEGVLFYVMPYVEGENLRIVLNREKQLGVDEAVTLTRAIAAALEHAHKQGVVHRDIKPENILLRDGDPMIADFGIALAVSHAGGSRLTETGLSIGTPHYMSPEQAMGDRELDARSDVYSLAAVMYEMLTGEPPYTGSTAQAIVARVITEEPRPITLQRRTVPPHVAETVHRALAKLPADRFASAAQFAEALVTPGAAVRSPTAEQTAPAPRARMSRSVVLAGVLGLVGLAAGLVLGRVTVTQPDTRVVRQKILDSLIAGRCCGGGLALSPDGSQLVTQRRTEDGQIGLAIRSLAGLEFRPLPGTENAASPFLSPDGRWLGFEAGGRLRKISLAGGPPITIVDVGDRVRGASWGQNDSIVYANDDDDRLYRVAASGGAAERISDGPATDFHRTPFLLPGDRKVVFSIDGPGPLEDIRLAVLDLETGVVDTLEMPGTMASYSPSGHLVFTGADGALLAQPFDPASGRPTGPAVALLDGVLIRGDGTGEFAISQAGDLAYIPGRGGSSEQLALASAAGRTDVPLPRPVNLEDPAIAPDGRRIALRLPDEGDSQDIWLLDRDQGTLTRLTTEGITATPVWTPDGSSIAYATQVDSLRAIYLRAADGSGAAERLLTLDFAVRPAGFTPDGSMLLVQALGRPGTGADIGLFTLGDSTVRWVAESEFVEAQGQLSPDGNWFAYRSNRSGNNEVYVQSVSGAGGRYQISTGGGHAPKWSPDGSTLYYGGQGSITAAELRLGNDVRVQARTIVLQTLIDFNFLNTNYDVHPTTGELLVILQGSSGAGLDINWILGWPEIVRGMETGR